MSGEVIVMQDEDERGKRRSSGVSQNQPQNEGKAHHHADHQTMDDIHEILARVGSQGRFQKLILYGILGPVSATEPLLALSVIFMLFIPDHRCQLGGADGPKSYLELQNSSLTSKCSLYPNDEFGNQTCEYGWVYDKSDYEETIPSQFNWVCDKVDYATLSFTLNAAGNAVGTVILGIWADKFGRKQTFFISSFIVVFGRVVYLFVASNIYAFLALQFFAGIGFPIMYIIPCTLAAELSGKEYRAWVYAWPWMTWVVGMAILPFIAWLARHWLTLGLVTSVPFFSLFLYWKFFPESPRWLISVGRIEECIQVFKLIAKVNGNEKQFDEAKTREICYQIQMRQKRLKSHDGIAMLFSRWGILRSLILVTIAWTMNSMIYKMITLNSTNLTGNQFINFFYLAIIEIPAGFVGNALVERIGRRWTQVFFFLVCIISSGITSVWSGSTLSVITAIIAKFAVTVSFMVVYLQGAEVFPTMLRSTGVGFASTFAGVAGILSPYLVSFDRVNSAVPWYANLILATIGMIASSFVPETLNMSLLETVDEADEFGRSLQYFSFLPTKEVAN